jgi:hypothetical protein
MLPDTAEDHTLEKYVELFKKLNLSEKHMETKLPIPA